MHILKKINDWLTFFFFIALAIVLFFKDEKINMSDPEGKSGVIFPVPVNCPFATVDNTQLGLNLAGGSLPALMNDASGFPYFTYGDNVLIESCRIQLPYAFGNGDVVAGPISFQLGYIDKNLNDGLVTQVGAQGQVQLPSFNVDFPINKFIRMPANVNSDWALRVLTTTGNVSMVNVPNSLNGQLVRGVLYCRVSYTLNRTL